MSKSFSSVILASGLSERMGVSKALLMWDQTTTFLHKLIHEYTEAGCNRIICMINEINAPQLLNIEKPENVSFIINFHPDWGRFYSVRTGLSQVQQTDYCFIQNVDNPFIRKELIIKLMNTAEPGAWCSPVHKGKGGHPVLLPPGIIPEIVKITDLNTTLADILITYPKIRMETEDDSILRNINTKEDYRRYFPVGG